MPDWRLSTETSRICRFGIAAEATAIPTLPVCGTAIDWTKIASGEDMYGWTPNGFDLAADDFTFETADEERLEVNPPTAQAVIATFRDKIALKSIAITSYEIAANIYAMASNATTTSQETKESTSFTRQALLIEWEAFGVLYCPSVEIRAGIPGGGIKTLGTQGLTVDVFGYSTTYPAGYSFKQFADA